jgi:hypothetical protein
MLLNLSIIIVLTIGISVANTMLDYTRETESKKIHNLNFNESQLSFLRISLDRNMKFNTLGILIIIALIVELYCFKEFISNNLIIYIIICLIAMIISIKLITMAYRLLLSISYNFPLHYWFTNLTVVPHFKNLVRVSELIMLISLLLYGSYLFLF